nr:unnamed protein product [Digitaria exilis]
MPDVKPAAAAAAATAAGAKAAAASSAAGDAPSPAAGPAPATAPTPAAANGNGTPQKPPPVPAAAFDMPKPNLRGLNKPKCIQCGNVARSRCPFQCCKACCYKAQNPCHIHGMCHDAALPFNCTFRLVRPDLEGILLPPLQQIWQDEASGQGAVSVSGDLRREIDIGRKEMRRRGSFAMATKKERRAQRRQDVASINKWRFMKLKEHMQGDIDAENEAYERYTQNVGLLEETFCPMEDSAAEAEAEATSEDEERMDLLVSEAKVRLKSDSNNAESFKERVATILDQKLKNLREAQSSYEDDKLSDENQDDYTIPVKFTAKQKMERAAKFNELLGKMTRARNEDDLKPCRDLIEQLFGKEVLFRKENDSTDKSNAMETEPPSVQESTSAAAAAAAQRYSFPKLCTRIEVGEDFASKLDADAEFLSLSEVAQL